jgi:branched-chain amino acid transport system ATP-binding protein
MADLLRVEYLSKRFGGIVATDDLTFSIPKGELHAVIGPNGAGKTTLIAQLSGQLGSDAGRIHFAGSDITAVPMHALADRVTVLVYGRVIASGKPEDIRSNAQVCDAYLGEQEAVYG